MENQKRKETTQNATKMFDYKTIIYRYITYIDINIDKVYLLMHTVKSDPWYNG